MHLLYIISWPNFDTIYGTKDTYLTYIFRAKWGCLLDTKWEHGKSYIVHMTKNYAGSK